MSLDKSEAKFGKTRFLKSGLVTVGALALDIYSFVLRKGM